MFDAYTDIAFPGGVKLEPFLDFWSRVTAAEDANRMSEMISFFPRLVYRGVKPVQGDSGEVLLATALREHVKNYNVAREIQGIEFSDETNQVANMSPYAKRELTQASGAAIYGKSGWYDGALANAAIKRFLTIRTPGSRLILGAWSHQGENLSPFATSLDDFEHTALLIRFFDRHLKDERNGVDDEPLVLYYTVGEEKWKTAATWPPPGTTPTSMYFGEGKHLAAEAPSAANASDAYAVDFTAGSGQETRWNNLTLLDIVHTFTRDRDIRDKKLLVYTGAPVTSDVEITGHPVISLYLSSTASDGAVFAYLEDVAPDGHVYPITDGQLRLACRKIATTAPPYEFPAPYRTFAKRDLEPLTPGEIAEITFDLYPISYRVRAGHAIRVSIAGADVDHFTRIPAAPAPAPTITIHRDAAHPSRLILPVLP
jgi:putative CocE/NonD family hydrolase